MTKGWLKLEKSLLKVAIVRNLMSGEIVEWSHAHTILFLYLKDRYDHFKRLGNEFFDNQESISFNCGMKLTATKYRLNDLTRVGALLVNKKRIQGFVYSNSYTVLDIFSSPMFEVATVDGEVMEKSTEVQNKGFVTKPAPKVHTPSNIYDDDEAPF